MTDYMELIDAYAEARHKYGSHTYNTTTADARKAVEEFFSALGAGGVERLRSGGEPEHACCNSWFMTLPEGRQAVLREDKWMLAHAAYDAGRAARTQAPAAAEPVASEVIAGALFDLLGYLTTLPKQNAVTLSGAHDAAPAVEQLEKWAAKRNFSLDEAEVLNWRKHVAPTTKAEPAPTSDGWLQDGDLLYRLTDDPRPYNRDEIKVTMADGSRTTESRTRRAGELLDMIRSPKASPADAQDADMFWNDDDPEMQHDSIDELLNYEICNGVLSVGNTLTLQRGYRLPNITIRITSIDDNACDAEYETIDAAMAAQGAKP